MRYKGKDRMTKFGELEMRNYTDPSGDFFLFLKSDGAFFAFRQVVAKKAIGHALGMDDAEINRHNTRAIGHRYWSGGNGHDADNGKAPRKNSKTAKVVALMQRPRGVTRERVLALTGWKAVSMQQMAAAGGVELRPEKIKGKPIRYHAGAAS